MIFEWKSAGKGVGEGGVGEGVCGRKVSAGVFSEAGNLSYCPRSRSIFTPLTRFLYGWVFLTLLGVKVRGRLASGKKWFWVVTFQDSCLLSNSAIVQTALCLKWCKYWREATLERMVSKSLDIIRYLKGYLLWKERNKLRICDLKAQLRPKS